MNVAQRLASLEFAVANERLRIANTPMAGHFWDMATLAAKVERIARLEAPEQKAALVEVLARAAMCWFALDEDGSLPPTIPS